MGIRSSGLALLAFCAGVAAFGAAGLALALFGAGLPFIAAAAIGGVCAALVTYVAGLPLQDRSAAERVRHLEGLSATLRHELRGVLSPALMVTDRLVNHEDPGVRRAGQAVVRSIERATELIVRNKQDLAPETATDPQRDTRSRVEEGLTRPPA